MKKEEKNGVSLFSQSDSLIGSDPLEEIFALNLGDFVAENLISKDLAQKIGKNEKDKKESLIQQLKELISIYSLNNTLCVLTFNSKEEQAIYTSITKAVSQMVEVSDCRIYLSYEFTNNENTENDLILAGATDNNAKKALDLDEDTPIVKAFNSREVVYDSGITAIPMHSNIQIAGIIELVSDKEIQPEFIELVQSIADLLGTSIMLQKRIDEANVLIVEDFSHTSDLQHIRAELTALIDRKSVV